MNVLEVPTRWSRTAAILGTGTLAVAITLGGAVGTAAADSPVVDFGSISFSQTNAADNTVYDINVILNLPAGTLPIGAIIPAVGARDSAPHAVNDSVVGTATDFVLNFIRAAGFSIWPQFDALAST